MWWWLRNYYLTRNIPMDRRFLNEDECDEGERDNGNSVKNLTWKRP